MTISQVQESQDVKATSQFQSKKHFEPSEGYQVDFSEKAMPRDIFVELTEEEEVKRESMKSSKEDSELIDQVPNLK